jgi:hypothetical protein
MSKEGLMENLHDFDGKLPNSFAFVEKIIYGKPNDACFFFVVELMARKLLIFANCVSIVPS